MKKNIIFILKLRYYIFNMYNSNKHYYFDSNDNNDIMKDQRVYDDESKLLLDYLYKNCMLGTVYLIQRIERFKMNIVVSKYDDEKQVLDIIEFQNMYCKKLINNNTMSSILFACSFRDKYFLFSTFPSQSVMIYDNKNEILEELKNYYFKFNVKKNRLWFCTNILKYIKVNDVYKITKFYPFLINL